MYGFASLLLILLLHGFQPPFKRIECVSNRYVDVFVRVVIVLVARYHDVVVGNYSFNTNVINVAFLVIVVRSLQYHSQTLDLITVSLELGHSFVNGLFDSWRMVDIAK